MFRRKFRASERIRHENLKTVTKSEAKEQEEAKEKKEEEKKEEEKK